MGCLADKVFCLPPTYPLVCGIFYNHRRFGHAQLNVISYWFVNIYQQLFMPSQSINKAGQDISRYVRKFVCNDDQREKPLTFSFDKNQPVRYT
jgi:hypothetical protein